MSETDRLSSVERILQSINSIAITGAFLGVVWLAVHIVSDPEGPNDVHRYFLSHFSNLVQPVVDVDVERNGDRFVYRYSLRNGWLALQHIKQFTVTAGHGMPDRTSSGWTFAYIPTGGKSFGMSWMARETQRGSNGIGRGESKTGFTISGAYLPTIVAVHAGNRLHYRGFAGLAPDMTTPAGKRITRWTLGPVNRSRAEDAEDVLSRLEQDVARAFAIGWIHEPILRAAIDGRLELAVDRLQEGDKKNLRWALEELTELVRSREGDGIRREGVELITSNAGWLRDNAGTLQEN